MKVSLCITVFNEEKHILRLLESIAVQTVMPDEVVIVDGGSTDRTELRIKNYVAVIPFTGKLRITNLKMLVKKGNRAVGRNEAIQKASGDIIALTDAGCELDRHWLEEITKPFEKSTTQVVSGYYGGRPQNVFEASLVPYVLVMPDRVNPSHFLPATRSMAMKKSVWEKMGGFPEKYRWNEDYVFSKRLEKEGVPIVFVRKAIVYWFPRETLWEGWRMFYNFARGDAQAGIWRPKVMLLMVRVILGMFLIVYVFTVQLLMIWEMLGGLVILYFLWVIWKNYRYVKNPLAFIFLPMWQLTSDSAVFLGTIAGFFERKNG